MLRKKLLSYSKIANKKHSRPIQAYIMTNMYPGAYTKALGEMKKIKCVKKISVVTGEYDIVVKVNVKNLGQLNELTNQLLKVNGVEKTNTQVIAKEYRLLSFR